MERKNRIVLLRLQKNHLPLSFAVKATCFTQYLSYLKFKIQKEVHLSEMTSYKIHNLGIFWCWKWLSEMIWVAIYFILWMNFNNSQTKKITWVLNYTLRHNRLLSPNWIYIRMWFHELLLHYHLEVQANPPKNGQKNRRYFLASMGKTGLSHDIFFNFSLWPFEVVEVKVWLLTSKR